MMEVICSACIAICLLIIFRMLDLIEEDIRKIGEIIDEVEAEKEKREKFTQYNEEQ